MKATSCKIVLVITFLVAVFSAACFAQDDVAVSTVGPKLLWEKEFKEGITYAAMSKDGSKIVVIANHKYKEIKDDTYLYGVRKEYHPGSNTLYCFDRDGNLLWDYKYGLTSTETYKLSRLAMSDDGKYTACLLERFITWEQDVVTIPYRSIQHVKNSAFGPEKVLYLDSEGKLLWEFKVRGFDISVSSNGEYVFVIPDADESGQPRDDFYFLSRDGKLLWMEPRMDSPTGGMSDDGQYVFTRTTLFDNNHNVVLKRDGKREYFQKICGDVIIAARCDKVEPDRIPVKLRKRHDLLTKCRIYNLKTGKLLWEKEGKTTSSPIVDCQAGYYALSDKYAFRRLNKKISVFDRKTGAVFQEWPFTQKHVGRLIVKGENHFLLINSSNWSVPYNADGLRKLSRVRWLVLYRADGSKRWTIQLPDESDYIIASEDDNLFGVVCSKHIFIYDILGHL